MFRKCTCQYCTFCVFEIQLGICTSLALSSHFEALHEVEKVLNFENIVKFKICSLAFKLYNNPSTVPAIFHNFLTPTTAVYSYNTRNSAKLNFYRPQVRTNIGKFTFKYSASVMWEAVPLALKKAKTFNKFKKLYKAHLISSQSNNICSVQWSNV